MNGQENKHRAVAISLPRGYSIKLSFIPVMRSALHDLQTFAIDTENNSVLANQSSSINSCSETLRPALTSLTAFFSLSIFFEL